MANLDYYRHFKFHIGLVYGKGVRIREMKDIWTKEAKKGYESES